MPGQNHEIRRTDCGNYKIFVKNGEHDYLKIFKAFLQGQLDTTPLRLANPHHMVWQANYEGTGYIIKVDQEKPKHFESKLWLFLRGPFYSRQMKAVNKAIQNGCRAVPEIYLVAEKHDRFLCNESVVIMELLEGEQFGLQSDQEQSRSHVVNAMNDLHKHNLTLGDCNPSNFLLDEHGCKIIDLSWHGFACIGQAQDVVSMKKRYGLNLATTGLTAKTAVRYIRIKKGLRSWLRKMRGKAKK